MFGESVEINRSLHLCPHVGAEVMDVIGLISRFPVYLVRGSVLRSYEENVMERNLALYAAMDQNIIQRTGGLVWAGLAVREYVTYGERGVGGKVLSPAARRLSDLTSEQRSGRLVWPLYSRIAPEASQFS